MATSKSIAPMSPASCTLPAMMSWPGLVYKKVKKIGEGTFGVVFVAEIVSSGSNAGPPGTVVAVKRLKQRFQRDEDCRQLAEVDFLLSVPKHSNLAAAFVIFRDRAQRLNIVMELMYCSLFDLLQARNHKPFAGDDVRSMIFQSLLGLQHVHKHDFIHCDIAPANILVSRSGVIKLADFGMVRKLHSNKPCENYVTTRWYRAPEVILGAGYSKPVDVWAIGAIAVELATYGPLFPGRTRYDQIWRIYQVLGSPGNWENESGPRAGGEWEEGVELARKQRVCFPKAPPCCLADVVTLPGLADFAARCLRWDPVRRPTATEALAHDWFQGVKAGLPAAAGREGNGTGAAV